MEEKILKFVPLRDFWVIFRKFFHIKRVNKIYDISDAVKELKNKFAKNKFKGKLLKLFKNSKLIRNMGLRYCRRHPDFVNFAIQEALDGNFSLKLMRKKFKAQKKSKKAN